MKKCAMLKIEIGKRKTIEEIELINQKKNQNTGRKGKLQVLRNIGSGHHKISGNKRKI